MLQLSDWYQNGELIGLEQNPVDDFVDDAIEALGGAKDLNGRPMLVDVGRGWSVALERAVSESPDPAGTPTCRLFTAEMLSDITAIETFMDTTVNDVLAVFLYNNGPDGVKDFEKVRNAHFRQCMMALFHPMVANKYNNDGLPHAVLNRRWEFLNKVAWRVRMSNTLPTVRGGERQLGKNYFSVIVTMKVRTYFSTPQDWKDA
ncbi:MAG: hypothetical protein JSS75_07185 [Bacteroidetes bacterium]|nr:hypothetical protein [Bacteroidota bacterium]